MSSTPVSLAELDAARPIPLDAAIWRDNLGALQAELPTIARALPANLPPHWRPVAGLDGEVTWRIERPGESPQWLGGTAVPAARAAGLLSAYQSGESNPALPSVGAGGELRWLLERLGSTRAVYVFEGHINALAAILRAHRLADDIRAGRCIFLLDDDVEEALSALLERWPGLQPPGTIVCLPDAAPDRIEHLRGVCLRVAARTAADRKQAAARIGSIGKPGDRDNAPRLALVARSDAQLAEICRSTVSEATALKWPVAACTVTSPRDVHPLDHHVKLAQFDPTCLISLEQRHAALPLDPKLSAWTWRLTTWGRPSPASPSERYLAASPDVEAALLASGAKHVTPFYWAAEEENSAARDQRDEILLIGDLPDTRPEMHGIDQPTHHQLWQALLQRVLDSWATMDPSRPEAILRDAERATAPLGDADLRPRFLALIQHVIYPAGLLRGLHAALSRLGPVGVVGAGWEEPARCVARSFHRLSSDWVASRPMFIVFAGRPDPLSPGLVQAAARGWPLMLHAPPNSNVTARLGGVLRPEEHIAVFTDFASLSSCAPDCARSAAGQRRAQRAQHAIRSAHLIRHRLATLAAML